MDLTAGRSAPSSIRSVAVFCGARAGRDPACHAAAAALGAGLAGAGITLVYGGGRVGLMGAVADAALDGGGRVIGVIPEFLTRREVAHPGATEMIVTDSMHSRKQRMFAVADAFVALPGGLGTLDETDRDHHLAPARPARQARAGLRYRRGRRRNRGGALPGADRGRDRGRIRASRAPATLFEVAPGVPALLARLAQLASAPGADAGRL